MTFRLEHDVARITAKMVATFVNSGTISHCLFLLSNSVTSEAAFTQGKSVLLCRN